MGISKNKTRHEKTKTSQIVNKNNPAQNFFSIAQLPTKKQTNILFVLFIIKKYTQALFPSFNYFLRISRSKTGKGNSNYYCPRFSNNTSNNNFFLVKTSRANFIQ